MNEPTPDREEQLTAELNTLRREITELKAIERTLRAGQERYQLLVENAPLAIVLVNHEGYIVLVNAKAEELFEYNRSELIGKTIQILLPKTDRSSHSGRANEFINGSKADLKGQRKDGLVFPIEVKRSFVETEHGTVSAWFINDITKRKQIEEERDKYIEDLSAFSHTVAHDLTDPLAVVIGYVDLLSEDFHSLSDEEINQCLYALSKHGYKMNNIIDELLLMVDKQEDVPLHPIDMRTTVENARQRLDYLIQENNAEVTIAEDWPVAVGYAPWIEEVWVNYLSNAIKYGGQPPRVEMGATRGPDHRVHFWVRDNGAGLAPEEQEQLFKMFTRLQKQNIDGHGLGLSIVKRIVEKLGGEVGVRNAESSQGSVFWFSLPIAKEQKRPMAIV